jgi:hypothetical protein
MGSSSQEMIYVPCLYRYDAEDCVHTKNEPTQSLQNLFSIVLILTALKSGVISFYMLE